MKRIAIVAALLLGGCSFSDAGQDAFDRLSTASVADIDQAYALAFLNGDKAAMDCYATLGMVIRQIQAYPAKRVGPVTTFQMGMDITSPVGRINLACAAERQAIKDRVSLFAGKAATLAASFGL